MHRLWKSSCCVSLKWHRSKACYQKVISDHCLKSRLPMSKMRQNVRENYWYPVAKMLCRVRRFRRLRHTTERVWFLCILCLQDKLSTPITIADFYNTLCDQLYDANIHLYCKAISLSCCMTLFLANALQCHPPNATVAVGILGHTSDLPDMNLRDFNLFLKLMGSLRGRRLLFLIFTTPSASSYAWQTSTFFAKQSPLRFAWQCYVTQQTMPLF